MTTLAESNAAPLQAQKQRLELSRLLNMDERNASPQDIALAKKVLSARSDANAYDKALADKAVNDLFRRGVLGFGGRAA